jgi:hypothetical protein
MYVKVRKKYSTCTASEGNNVKFEQREFYSILSMYAAPLLRERELE